MGRSIKHLLEVAESLQEKGVTLRVLEQAIDTSTPQGTLTLHLLSAPARFELSQVSERTRSALAGRARGRKSPIPQGLAKGSGTVRFQANDGQRGG